MFDCSFRPQNGTRSIHYMGHLKMMGAVQPFASGAISKTINMPEECTVEDVMEAYTESWRMGLKAVAIYRDNSKKVQPMSSGAGKTAEKKSAAAAAAAVKEVAAVTEKVVYRPVRRKLPDERQSITHKFSIGGHEGYITVGMFEDGTPGEIFVTMAKEGSTISGLMDSFATSISYCLQYGVPLKFLVDKFGHVRFEPSGWTGNPPIRMRSRFRIIFSAGWRRSFWARSSDERSWRDAGAAADRAESAGVTAVSGGGDGCADVRGVRRNDDAQWELL